MKIRLLDNIVSAYVLLVTIPIFLSACQSSAQAPSSDWPGQLPDSVSARPDPLQSNRFVKLDQNGNALENQQQEFSESPWYCVLDRQTQLLWEVKQGGKIFNSSQYRYVWSNPEAAAASAKNNHSSSCEQPACDTWAYFKRLNAEHYCGRSDWRLPGREELRSLVDYRIPYPGPTIAQAYFPNTLSQFYWSNNVDAEDKDSAWGIGFSFGFDYSYLKIHAGYIRAVSGQSHLARRLDNRSSKSAAGDLDIDANRNSLSRYHLHENGKIEDLQYGLVWQPCSWGQQYSAKHGCVGQALALNYAQALVIAEQMRKISGLAWHIPSLHQLSSSVALDRYSPAIDNKIFPNSVSANYWSSTAFVQQAKQHWVVNFVMGGNSTEKDSSKAYLRLVYPSKGFKRQNAANR